MAINRRDTLTGIGAGGVVLSLSACSGEVGGALNGPLKGGRAADTLVRLGDAEIRTFDPHLFTELASSRVAADQFVGLTRFDGRGEVIPALADQWTVGANGLNWRFPVRAGLKFSDGAPITAAVIVGSIARMRDPKTASTHAAMAVNIVSVEEEPSSNGAGAVVFTLAKPYPDLPGLLAHAAFAAVPLHRIAALGEGWTNERPLVTSGPYRATQWVLNSAITLERNPYWATIMGAARIPRVIWKPSENNLSAMRAFLGGEADITGDFPPMRGEWLRAELNQHGAEPAKIEPYLGSYYFIFNTSKPPFNDARVRAALSMAFEREWLIDKVLLSGAPPAYGLLPPGLVQVAGKDAPDFRPDWAGQSRPERLGKAAALLAEAGYSGSNPLTFELRFNSSPDHRRICAAAAAMWADLGVEARLFNTESALHFDALRRADFAMARSGWIADLAAPENFLENFISTAGDRNYSRYSNAKYDAAMVDAAGQADADTRARAMLKAEAMLMADAPILPIYYYVARSLVHPRVTGWQSNAMNVHPNMDLALEPMGGAR
jgi:oligopeptide transport system substrate-binding protein